MPTFEITSPTGKKYRVTAPEGATADDALNRIRRQEQGKPEEPTLGETAADVARQGVGGLSKAITETAMAPLNLSAWATGTQGRGFQGIAQEALSPWLEQPDAETTAGRYAGRVGEAIGGTALPSSLALRAASKLPAIAPAAGGLKEAFLRPIATHPGTAAAIDIGAGAAGGLAAQGAEEAGASPGLQNLAGIAGGIAAPLGAVPLARAVPGVLGSTKGAVPLPRFGKPDPAKVEDRAYQMIADKAIAAGITPEELEKRLATGAWSRTLHTTGEPPDATVLADLDESLARLLGSAVRQHQEASNIARPMVTARQTGVTPAEWTPPGKPGEHVGVVERQGLKTYLQDDPDRFIKGAAPAGQHQRIIDAHRRALRIKDEDFHGHKRTADQTVEDIVRRQEAESDPAYNRFRKAGAMYDLSKDAGVAGAVAKWRQIAETTNIPEIRAVLNAALERFAPGGVVVKNVKDFDLAKRYTDSEITRFLQKGTSATQEYTGAQLLKLKDELVGAVDAIKKNKIGEKYRTARRVYSSHAESMRDIQLGRDIYTGKVDPAAFKDLKTRDAQKRARLGYHSEFAADVSSNKAHIDVTKKMTSLDRLRERATLIERTETKAGRMRMRRDPDSGAMVPRDMANRPRKFGEYLKGEEAMIRTRDVVKGGSPTAERLADDAAFDVLHTIGDIAQGGTVQTTMRAFRFALDKTFGMKAEVAAAIAQKLTSADPAVRAKVINELRLRMGKDRFARLAEIMSDYQRQSLSGSTGAGLTSPQLEQE